jgi:hypothetical protein
VKADTAEHPLDFDRDGQVSGKELALAIGLGGASFLGAVAFGVALAILYCG